MLKNLSLLLRGYFKILGAKQDRNRSKLGQSQAFSKIKQGQSFKLKIISSPYGSF